VEATFTWLQFGLDCFQIATSGAVQEFLNPFLRNRTRNSIVNTRPVMQSPMRIDLLNAWWGLLANSISSSAFADSTREIIQGLSVREMRHEISLDVFHQDVIYVDEKRSIIEQGQVNPYVQGIPRPLRPLFVKPKKYAGDQEYRFVFLFQHKHYGQLAVRKDPVDIPILPITDI